MFCPLRPRECLRPYDQTSAFRQEAPMPPSPCSIQVNRAANPIRIASNPPHPLQGVDSLALIKRYGCDQEICGEACPAVNWFRVISGGARQCVTRADGRRQIVELLLPGEFFGFCARNEYDFSVEAVAEGTRIACYPRQRIDAMAERDHALARELRMLAYEAISRSQAQLLIVGRLTATEKVGAFLLAMSGRLSVGPRDVVTLPISRYDIADYLAISVETVSRSLTELRRSGLIAFTGTRRVRIIDRNALEDLHALPCSVAPHRSSLGSQRSCLPILPTFG
jgi:CRP/FNR family transcriptional regulator, nitrogen fixation regulation protein